MGLSALCAITCASLPLCHSVCLYVCHYVIMPLWSASLPFCHAVRRCVELCHYAMMCTLMYAIMQLCLSAVQVCHCAIMCAFMYAIIPLCHYVCHCAIMCAAVAGPAARLDSVVGGTGVFLDSFRVLRTVFACLSVCLPACLPACQPAGKWAQPVCLPACERAGGRRACLPSCPTAPACLPAYLPARLPPGRLSACPPAGSPPVKTLQNDYKHTRYNDRMMAT